MAKKSIHLGSKNFFTLVVLSVSVLSLMFVTYASQQRTSTQSDARMRNENPNIAVVGNRTPSWDYKGSTSGNKDVTYSLELKNNSKLDQRYLIWAVVYTKDWEETSDWKYKFLNRDNSKNIPLRKTIEAGGSSGTKITISREDAKVPKGRSTYKVRVIASPCKNNVECRNINDTHFPDNLARYTTDYFVDN